MRTLNYRTRFIDVASEINSQMPDFVVEKVAHALNDERKSVNGSRVLVVGVAYKTNIDDIRESPALDVIRLLEGRGAEVVYHDPFIPSFTEDGHRRTGVPLDAGTLAAADAVVIVTDHTDDGLSTHRRSRVGRRRYAQRDCSCRPAEGAHRVACRRLPPPRSAVARPRQWFALGHVARTAVRVAGWWSPRPACRSSRTRSSDS